MQAQGRFGWIYGSVPDRKSPRRYDPIITQEECFNLRGDAWETDPNWGSSKGCLRIIEHLGACRRVSFNDMMMGLVWLKRAPEFSIYRPKLSI